MSKQCFCNCLWPDSWMYIVGMESGFMLWLNQHTIAKRHPAAVSATLTGMVSTYSQNHRIGGINCLFNNLVQFTKHTLNFCMPRHFHGQLQFFLLWIFNQTVFLHMPCHCTGQVGGSHAIDALSYTYLFCVCTNPSPQPTTKNRQLAHHHHHDISIAFTRSRRRCPRIAVPPHP